MTHKLTPQEEKLALEIATALDDLDSLSAHRKYVVTYSETFLRKMLMRALSIPADQIRKTRGALYTSLIQGNARHYRD